MPPSLLRLRSAARSLLDALGPRINDAITDDLEPEFKYEYEEPGNAYHELLALLPHAIQLRSERLTAQTKHAILHRVVLRDIESLTRFFIAVIKSPRCGHMVEELHCHVDLSSHTTEARLSRDIALIGRLVEHLDRCPISVDILIAIKDHLSRELNQQPYHPDADVSFRQAMFLSLLGHLPNLHTLRMTIHGPGHQTLSQLRAAIQRHYPIPFREYQPCHSPGPALRKLSFYPADNYHPTSLWHPFTLWPLLDLPGIAELEVEHNPATWTRPVHTDIPALKLPSEQNQEDDEDRYFYRTCSYLHTLRLKHLPPLPGLSRTLYRLFSSFTMLHTLSICGTAVLGTGGDGLVNLEELLSMPNVAKALEYLSVDLTFSTRSGEQKVTDVVPGGAGVILRRECIKGLRKLRGLYIPMSTIFGNESDTRVILPRKLERLEVVEDLSIPGQSGEGPASVMGRMRRLAKGCGKGRFPALKEVVLWVRDGGWGGGEEGEVRGAFTEVGVQFECKAYVLWEEGRVGGWKEVEERLEHDSEEEEGGVGI